MVEVIRAEKEKAVDFPRLIDELKALKNRLYNVDMARLEEQKQAAIETAVKAAERRAKTGSPEEIQRLQSEAKRLVEAEHERSKEILASKFTKLDNGLLTLTVYFQNSAPLREQEGKLKGTEEKLNKLQEEIGVRQKVLAHEVEEMERDKKLFQAAQEASARKAKELEEKLSNLDVAERAKQLDQLKEELDGKLKAYEGEMEQLNRQRDETNRDFDKLGEKRAELDAEAEKLQAERRRLQDEKAGIAETVAREMAATFEAFVRDMLRPGPPRPPVK